MHRYPKIIHALINGVSLLMFKNDVVWIDVDRSLHPGRLRSQSYFPIAESYNHGRYSLHPMTEYE